MIQGTDYTANDTGYRLQHDTGPRVHDTENRAHDEEYRVYNKGYTAHDTGHRETMRE